MRDQITFKVSRKMKYECGATAIYTNLQIRRILNEFKMLYEILQIYLISAYLFVF